MWLPEAKIKKRMTKDPVAICLDVLHCVQQSTSSETSLFAFAYLGLMAAVFWFPAVCSLSLAHFHSSSVLKAPEPNHQRNVFSLFVKQLNTGL